MTTITTTAADAGEATCDDCGRVSEYPVGSEQPLVGRDGATRCFDCLAELAKEECAVCRESQPSRSAPAVSRIGETPVCDDCAEHVTLD